MKSFAVARLMLLIVLVAFSTAASSSKTPLELHSQLQGQQAAVQPRASQASETAITLHEIRIFELDDVDHSRACHRTIQCFQTLSSVVLGVMMLVLILWGLFSIADALGTTGCQGIECFHRIAQILWEPTEIANAAGEADGLAEDPTVAQLVLALRDLYVGQSGAAEGEAIEDILDGSQ